MPKLRTSTNTCYVETTETVCPYCDRLLTFMYDCIGEKVQCRYSACKKKFIVGDEE